MPSIILIKSGLPRQPVGESDETFGSEDDIQRFERLLNTHEMSYQD